MAGSKTKYTLHVARETNLGLLIINSKAGECAQSLHDMMFSGTSTFSLCIDENICVVAESQRESMNLR